MYEGTCWLGVTEMDHKADCLESFHFEKKSYSDGKLGTSILVLDELLILAVFWSCSSLRFELK